MKRYLLFVLLYYVIICMSFRGAKRNMSQMFLEQENLFFRHLCVGVMRPA